MARFDRLPSNALQIIVSFLSKKSQCSVLNEDVLAFSQVCKAFRLVGEPELYRRVSFVFDNAGSKNFLILFPFVRLLLERPLLWKHIKHVQINCRSAVKSLQKNMVGTNQIVSHLNFPNMYNDASKPSIRAKWIDDALGVGLPASLALILGNLHRLETLEFTFCSSSIGRKKCSVLAEHAFYNLSSRTSVPLDIAYFRYLRGLSYSHEGISLRLAKKGDKSPDYVAFFGVKTLHMVTLHQTDFERARNASVLPTDKWTIPVASSLRTLTLIDCRITTASLHTILLASPILEDLFFRRAENIRITEPRQYQMISQALWPVRKTLKRLQLSCVFRDHSYEPEQTAFYLGYGGKSTRFLRAFINLRYLEISHARLIELQDKSGLPLIALLPRRLEELCVSDDVGTENNVAFQARKYGAEFRHHRNDLDNLTGYVYDSKARRDLTKISIKFTVFQWRSICFEKLASACEKRGLVLDLQPRKSPFYSRRGWHEIFKNKAWWGDESMWLRYRTGWVPRKIDPFDTDSSDTGSDRSDSSSKSDESDRPGSDEPMDDIMSSSESYHPTESESGSQGHPAANGGSQGNQPANSDPMEESLFVEMEPESSDGGNEPTNDDPMDESHTIRVEENSTDHIKVESNPSGFSRPRSRDSYWED
ncbi:MAG: hypothetical protein M4579_000334 [Chaenotheca gracillima]|nr:MAG: hypothetical protein M4579_000334 [Chaenotheca gracillima]